MISFIKADELTSTVKAVLAKGPPRLAVAFWGAGASQELGLLPVAPSCRIICNLGAGGTNPKEIEVLLKAGADVRQNNRLHAKVYLGGDGVVVGSSNASANGLSRQGEECAGWIEANVALPAGPGHTEISRWFEQLWGSRETRRIKDRDLELAHEMWSRRRHSAMLAAHQGAAKTPQTIHDIESLRDARFYVVLYSENASDAAITAKNVRRQQIRESGGKAKGLDIFEDWDSLPDEAELICFYTGPRGSFRFEGVWHMPEVREKAPTSTGVSVLFCYRSRYKIDATTVKKWRSALEKLKASENWNGGEAVIELGDFADHYLR